MGLSFKVAGVIFLTCSLESYPLHQRFSVIYKRQLSDTSTEIHASNYVDKIW